MFKVQPHHYHRDKSVIPRLIFFLGLTISLLGGIAGKTYMRKHNIDKFNLEGKNYVKSITHEVEYNLSVLSPLSAFYKGSEFVTRQEFSEFTKEAYSNGSYQIQALEWIPRIKANQLELFEKQVQSEGYKDFYIKEKRNDEFIKAQKRSEYYPVLYIEPFAGNEKAFGFDLASSLQRKKALKHSLENNTVVATNAISLVQETKRQFGFLVFSPIYKGPATTIEERQNNILGFALGVFRISDIIEDAKIQARFPTNYSLTLNEVLPTSELNTIYQSEIKGRKNNTKTSNYSFIDTIDVAGISWRIEISPQYSLGRENYHLIFAFTVFMAGLILSGFLSSYLRRKEQYINSKELEIKSRIIYEENLKIAKEKAEEATVAKSQFLANMSHEIRTPMNAIIGFTEVLQKSSLTPSQKKHCKIIQTASKELLSIINAILDSSKLDSNKMVLENIVFNLSDLVENIALTYNVKAKMKNIALQFDYDHSMPQQFIGDRNRLRQIITNLVDNAIKFTEKGSVTIIVRPSGKKDHIDFLVKDTGIGIRPEVLEKLFDPFVQADSTISRTHGGTGLGTSICKKLVELMGGEITVESDFGVGSTFHFTIELKESKESIPKEVLSQPLEFYTLKPLRILLAEDVVENAELCTLRLEEWGHTVVLASNGKEALDILNEADTHFDIALIDVHMPVMDGLEAIKIIRKKESDDGAHIPILLLTASVLAEEKKSYSEIDIDGIVSKPIDFNLLFSEISRVLSINNPENSVLDISESSIETLPSMPGINTEEAMQRWRNSRVYLKNLSSFVKDTDEECNKIKAMIKESDNDGACTLIHKLKGGAGNLALPRMVETLEKLETLLSSDSLVDSQSLIVEFENAFTEVEISLQKLLGQPSTRQKKVELTEENLKKIEHLMADLKKSFNHCQIDDTLVNEFLELLNKSLDSTLIDEFEQALDKFDFTLVLETVDKIADTLHIKEE